MITVNRIGKHLGAEIAGVDLSRPMDDNIFAKISSAFFDNHSDLSYKQFPSLQSALYALEVPVSGGVVLGHTNFASTTVRGTAPF